MAFLWKHKMAHGLFVETQNGKGLIIAILWKHKMS
jgi:hypothetical protein